MSNCPGLVDFAIGLVNSVLDLPQRASEVFWGIQITEELLNPHQNFGIVGVTFGPLHAQVSQAPRVECNLLFHKRLGVALQAPFEMLEKKKRLHFQSLAAKASSTKK